MGKVDPLHPDLALDPRDYIFYSADSLTVESLLELLDEDSLRKDTALPSTGWSSDHIALLVGSRCKPRIRISFQFPSELVISYAQQKLQTSYGYPYYLSDTFCEKIAD